MGLTLPRSPEKGHSRAFLGWPRLSQKLPLLVALLLLASSWQTCEWLTEASIQESLVHVCVIVCLHENGFQCLCVRECVCLYDCVNVSVCESKCVSLCVGTGPGSEVTIGAN